MLNIGTRVRTVRITHDVEKGKEGYIVGFHEGKVRVRFSYMWGIIEVNLNRIDLNVVRDYED
jgi:hypothetical protein